MNETPTSQASPSSHPYRTSDQTSELLELTATLSTRERELDKLRSWKRRSRIGVLIALVVATVHVAAFSGLLVLRYVPKASELGGSSCPEPIAAAMQAPVGTTETPEDTGCGESDPCPHATALDQVGGEEKIPALATEITRALYSDPTLARSLRFQAFGRERAETVVRQQLQSLLGATQDDDAEDTFELAWDQRPTRTEWAAATEVVVKALEKHEVSASNLEQLRGQIENAGSQATDDTPKRRRILHARASVGLACPETQISSRPLESSFNRIVTGCGKSAIYSQTDPESGSSAWKRDENP